MLGLLLGALIVPSLNIQLYCGECLVFPAMSTVFWEHQVTVQCSFSPHRHVDMLARMSGQLGRVRTWGEQSGRRKLAFSLSIKYEEINGSGEVSPGRGIQKPLEKIELKMGLRVMGLGIWELLGSNGIFLLFCTLYEQSQS